MLYIPVNRLSFSPPAAKTAFAAQKGAWAAPFPALEQLHNYK
jgi:hypothetical protein